MELNLAGTVAIVTGASRGLGEACVGALVAEGASVLAVARTTADLERVAAIAPDRIHAVPCDLSDRAAVSALAGLAVDRFGRLDAVVNNAGIAPAGNWVDQDAELLDHVLGVNLVAPALLAQSAARWWIAAKHPGSVVNIGSTSSLKGKPLLAAYSASKGALLRLTEALSGEWARHGIRVNLIAPGAFETAAQAAVFADQGTLDARLRKIPLRRMGAPGELGPLVCYLASPASGFVTGSCFVIDGGEVAKL